MISLDKKTYWNYLIFFAAVYFFSINGVAALPNLSLQFLLKDVFHLTPAQAAYFQAVTLVAWVIKPLWGYISDKFPLAGYRRKSYLIFTSIVAALCWTALALVQHSHVEWVLFWITAAYMAYAFQDVVSDALMVQVGKPAHLTGRFQSIQWSAVYLAMILTSFLGGILADKARRGVISYQSIFGASAIFPLLIAFLAWRLVQESKTSLQENEASPFREVFKNSKIWLFSFFLFLWTFSPSLGTPFFYYCVDTLKFDASFMGSLQALASFTAFITSFLFAKWIDRLPIRKFLVAIIFFGVAAILSHLFYFHPWVVSHSAVAKGAAIVTRIPFAALDTVVFLMLANLAAKASPAQSGGSAFALFMSFYNLGQLGSSILGGILISHVSLPWLVVISAFFSLFALLILPFLDISEPLTSLEKRIRKVIAK